MTEPDNISPPEDPFATDLPDRRGRPGRLPPENTARITRRITTITVLVGVLLAIGKYFLWDQSHSVGILSSLVHSTLDLAGALSSFIAVRYAARPPDQHYRFGRGKAESFSAIFQVCLILLAAFHLLSEVIERMSNPEAVNDPLIAVAIMGIFIVITFWLLIAQSWAVRATGSLAVRGDRAHYFSDILSNVAVIIGIIVASYTSLQWADALVGGLMALWLIWTAYRVARVAWSQLLDMELNKEERDLISRLALVDERVVAIHDLRSRASGPHIHIQMRLDMDETLSLSEAHEIVLGAEQRMMSAFQAADILIHPHPVGCGHKHGNVRFREDEEKN